MAYTFISFPHKMGLGFNHQRFKRPLAWSHHDQRVSGFFCHGIFSPLTTRAFEVLISTVAVCFCWQNFGQLPRNRSEKMSMSSGSGLQLAPHVRAREIKHEHVRRILVCQDCCGGMLRCSPGISWVQGFLFPFAGADVKRPRLHGSSCSSSAYALLTKAVRHIVIA